MLFQKDKVYILCSSSKGISQSQPFLFPRFLLWSLSAKILAQIQGPNSFVPVEILAQAKAKDAPSQALPKFLDLYTSHKRIGTLVKESHTGKLIDEWTEALSSASSKPDVTEMSPAVSSILAAKDEEELVSPLRTHLVLLHS